MRGGKILKYLDIKREIENNNISSVYFFLGEEKYLKQEIIQLIKSKIIPKGFSDDFNFHHFYSSDVTLPHVIEVCNTLPAFSEKRMVVVENIDKFKNIKILNDYTQSPSDCTCLILASDERNMKDIKLSIKNIKTVVFYPLFDNQLIQWIIKKVRKYNKQITGQAAEKLIQLCDNTLLEINNEVEKLLIYCKDKKEISINNVVELIGDIKGYDIFKLIDAIFSGDYALSLKIFKKLLHAGLNLYSFFAMLNKSLHEIYHIKYLLEVEKKLPADIIKQKGMKPFRYKKIVENIKKYSLKKFSFIVNVLFEFDCKFKSIASVHRKRLLEDLIYSLCTRGR